MTSDMPAGEQGSGPPAAGSAWRGWVLFAATILALLGVFHAIAGLVALFEEDYYLVTASRLVISADFTAWGWTHLLIGALFVLTAVALLNGATWARVVAIAVAFVSAIVNVAFLSAYPLWCVIMITLDVLVIYAVTAHGDRESMRGY
jgi:hypothetical protein